MDFEQLVEEFPGMAYRCRHDADWTIEYVSSGSRTLLGWTPRELAIDRVVTVSALIHPDDLANVSLAVERGVEERRTFRTQYRIRTRDGSYKWVAEVGRAVFDGDTLVALEGYLIDVSEQVRAQQALFAESRSSAITKFASGIAHDLNNLLTSVLAVTSLIELDEHANVGLRSEAGSLAVLASSIAKLSRQLTHLGKGSLEAVRPIDLAKLVDATAPVLRQLVEARTLEIRCERGLCVRADPTRIEQALINLVINARDATTPTGKIDIAVQSSGNIAQLSVADDGVGIDEAVLPHIFDPYFTTKSTDRGTGLGLVVVEQVAHELGARIDVESAPGQGTRFVLRIPAIESGEVSAQVPEMGGEVVLLVDDDELVRRMLARGLRRLGYTVLEADDGEAALRVAERHRGTIHVLVSDGRMPKMTGPELARVFASEYRDTARILITGDTVPGHGFDARLEKPFPADALARTIRDVLALRQTTRASKQVAAADDTAH